MISAAQLLTGCKCYRDVNVIESMIQANALLISCVKASGSALKLHPYSASGRRGSSGHHVPGLSSSPSQVRAEWTLAHVSLENDQLCS